MAKKEEKLYNAPQFLYGDRVEVIGQEIFPNEDKDSVLAEFYIGETGTVIDVVQYSDEELPQYCVLLDEDLGSQYTDVKNKCIWISENYLESYGDFGDVFDDADDEHSDDTCDEGLLYREPSKEEIRKGLKESAIEEIAFSSDKFEILVAREILDILEKAEKYENLSN